jgi:hypothetical protein
LPTSKKLLGADHLGVVADRGYVNRREILACERADITVTMPKPTGRFGKQDFVYRPTGIVPLPGGREADLSIYQRGGRQGAASLLDDDGMFELGGTLCLCRT